MDDDMQLNLVMEAPAPKPKAPKPKKQPAEKPRAQSQERPETKAPPQPMRQNSATPQARPQFKPSPRPNPKPYQAPQTQNQTQRQQPPREQPETAENQEEKQKKKPTRVLKGINRQGQAPTGKQFRAFAPQVLQTPEISQSIEESQVFAGKLFHSDKIEDFGIDPKLISCLQSQMGITKLTHIQAESFQPIMAGHDILIKSETGSGKTLAFSIPLVQKLASINPPITRADGTFAIILSPTRELSIQTCEVISKLRTPYIRITPGTVMGGESKKSEKARIRKGLNILIATPGRLLDHLQNTSSFYAESLKFIILDEADRLLDLGFEKDVREIIRILDERRNPANPRPQSLLISATLSKGVSRLADYSLHDPVRIGFSKEQKPDVSLTTDAQKKKVYESDEEEEEGEGKKEETKKKPEVKSEDQPGTVTFDDDEDGNSPSMAVDGDAPDGTAPMEDVDFVLPPGLKQNFVIVPNKLRLVALISFLRWKTDVPKPTKVVVFMSCCDSVEFHHSLFSMTEISASNKADTAARKSLKKDAPKEKEEDTKKPGKKIGSGTYTIDEKGEVKIDGEAQAFGSDDEGDEEEKAGDMEEEEVEETEPMFTVPVFKLHGEMSQKERTSVYFSYCKAKSGILICTDVAARGLDLPDVSWIVQYDTPGDPKDYIHRVGRTARIGHTGDALLFLLPTETLYVDLLNTHNVALHPMGIELVLESSILMLGRVHKDVIEASSALQYILENHVLEYEDLRTMAMEAFRSHVRAYATHTRSTKHIFHIKNLHLGHVAKSMALRESPSAITNIMRKAKDKKLKKEQIIEMRKAREKRLEKMKRMRRANKRLIGEEDGVEGVGRPVYHSDSDHEGKDEEPQKKQPTRRQLQKDKFRSFSLADLSADPTQESFAPPPPPRLPGSGANRIPVKRPASEQEPEDSGFEEAPKESKQDRPVPPPAKKPKPAPSTIEDRLNPLANSDFFSDLPEMPALPVRKPAKPAGPVKPAGSRFKGTDPSKVAKINPNELMFKKSTGFGLLQARPRVDVSEFDAGF